MADASVRWSNARRPRVAWNTALPRKGPVYPPRAPGGSAACIRPSQVVLRRKRGTGSHAPFTSYAALGLRAGACIRQLTIAGLSVTQTSTEHLEDVVRRLQERWGPQPPKSKLTLIQGGRKDQLTVSDSLRLTATKRAGRRRRGPEARPIGI
jgi:hypothetical protein